MVTPRDTECLSQAKLPPVFIRLLVTLYANIRENVPPAHYHRWVTPFRAVWGAGSDLVMCGNMKRGADLINASTGMLVGNHPRIDGCVRLYVHKRGGRTCSAMEDRTIGREEILRPYKGGTTIVSPTRLISPQPCTPLCTFAGDIPAQ
jgi:hypothetical protein